MERNPNQDENQAVNEQFDELATRGYELSQQEHLSPRQEQELAQIHMELGQMAIRIAHSEPVSADQLTLEDENNDTA